MNKKDLHRLDKAVYLLLQHIDLRLIGNSELQND